MKEYYFGYVRISSTKQSMERQIRNILEYEPRAVIYKETHKRYDLENRVEFKKLIKRIKSLNKSENKVSLICDAVDRFGSDDDCFILYTELYKLGVELIFLKEPYANTSYISSKIQKSKIPRTNTEVDYIIEGIEKYLEITILKEVKEAFKRSHIEIENIHQRVKEGIETARLKNKVIGRPKLTKADLPVEFIDKYNLWKKGKITKTQFALDMNWSRPTLNRMIELYNKKDIIDKKLTNKQIIIKNSKYFNGSMTDAEIIKKYKMHSSTFYRYKKEIFEELNLLK